MRQIDSAYDEDRTTPEHVLSVRNVKISILNNIKEILLINKNEFVIEIPEMQNHRRSCRCS